LAAENLDDAARFTEIGRQFHHEMARGCGNETMAVVMGSLEALWTSHEQQWAEQSVAQGAYPSLAARRAVLNAHVKLAKAVADGDVERARRLATRHVVDTQSFVVSDADDTLIQAVPAQVIARHGQR
jgi:DNA-binding FadR family transcriptional regulator